MCGLYGFVATNPTGFIRARQKFLATMCVWGTVRGSDSAGMAFLPPANSPHRLFKSLGVGTNLLGSKGVRESIEGLSGTAAVLGHHRAATKGSVKLENAHPFFIPASADASKGLVGMHNGTLWHVPGEHDHEVDSYQLFAQLESTSAPTEVLSACGGAYAAVWSNLSTGDVFFARNYARPLHVCFGDHGSTLYFASEPHMLWAALVRAEVGGIAKQGILEAAPHKLYRISAKGGQLEERIERFEIPKPKRSPVRPGATGGSPVKKSFAGSGWRNSGCPELNATPWERGNLTVMSVIDWEPYRTNRNNGRITGLVGGEDASQTWEALVGGIHKKVWEKWKDISSMLVEVDWAWVGVSKELTISCRPLRRTRFDRAIRNFTLDTEHDARVPTIDEISLANAPSVVAQQKLEELEAKSEDKKQAQEDTESKKATIFVPGPDEKYISEGIYRDLTKHGCSWCSCDLPLDLACKVVWWPSDIGPTPVCQECQQQADRACERTN